MVRLLADIGFSIENNASYQSLRLKVADETEDDWIDRQLKYHEG